MFLGPSFSSLGLENFAIWDEALDYEISKICTFSLRTKNSKHVTSNDKLHQYLTIHQNFISPTYCVHRDYRALYMDVVTQNYQ